MNRLLGIGEPAPWFRAAAVNGNPDYAFHSAAGRWIVMLFPGDGAPADAALATLARHRALFDDAAACFFGVSTVADDAASGRIAQSLPGVRWFLDADGAVSALFGAAARPHWLLLDPMQRVVARAALADGDALIARLRALLAAPAAEPFAPVLVVPGVLPPATCRTLIDLYRVQGGEESGFMHDIDGVTVPMIDHQHKRRADARIDDPRLIAALKGRMNRVLRPLIHRAFQFDASRIERFIVACYDAETGGHFRAHRDNTTKGTAHRRFAVTINLNAEEYDGGDLAFPEFGARTYRAPTGGAVVFSCSLLHEARPVTRGRRYAFLPFLYDDAGARLRERNLAHVAPELQAYRSGLPDESLERAD